MTAANQHPASTRTEPAGGGLAVTLTEQGAGRPVLVLHGGGGPDSVAGFAASLALGARVITPAHPGFGGTPRPAAVRTIEDLAGLYSALIDRLGFTGVVVAGFSMGGWIAAELAAADAGRGRISGLVLADAVGIEVPGEKIADVFPLTPAELSALSYHDPGRFALDPATMTAEQRAQIAANFAALAVYGGARGMADPGLRARLAQVTVPVLVVWGDSDGVVTPAYGRAFADAFPAARFEVIADCGHLPQIEQPAPLLALVRDAFPAVVPG